jgi:hypothetical protein
VSAFLHRKSTLGVDPLGLRYEYGELFDKWDRIQKNKAKYSLA